MECARTRTQICIGMGAPAFGTLCCLKDVLGDVVKQPASLREGTLLLRDSVDLLTGISPIVRQNPPDKTTFPALNDIPVDVVREHPASLRENTILLRDSVELLTGISPIVRQPRDTAPAELDPFHSTYVRTANPYYDGVTPIKGGSYPVRSNRITAHQTITSLDIASNDRRQDRISLRKLKYPHIRPQASHNEKASRRDDYREKQRNTAKSKRKDQKEKTDKTEKARKIKNKNKNKIKINPEIKPHSVIDTVNTSLFSELFDKGIENMEPDLILRILETVFSTKLFLETDSKVLKGLILALEYGKNTCGSSFCSLLWTYVQEHLVDLSFLTDWSFSDLLAFLKSALLDWESFKVHEGFKAFFSLLTYIVTLGFLNSEDFDFKLGKFDIFRVEALKKQVAASDFIDALWRTVIFISESAFSIYNGEWRNLLTQDSATTNFETEYYLLKKQFDFVLTGSYDKMDRTESEFAKLLDDTILVGATLKRISTGSTRTRIENYHKDLISMHAKYVQVRVDGNLREAPYSYLICGPSSAGKSTLGSFLMRYILEVNDYPHSADYLTTLNSGDKFFSNYKNHVTGIFFDDFANTNPQFVERSPCNTLLEFVNNLPLYLNQADVEFKGRISAKPKVVGVSTNIPDVNSGAYSLEPGSINRRMVDHLHITVKEQFRKGSDRTELDPAKILAAFPDFGDDGDFANIPDIWEIDIYNVVIVAQPRLPKLDEMESNKHNGDPWKLVLAEHNGLPMQGIGLEMLQEYMRDVTARHFAEQKKIVANDRKMNKNHVCTKCKFHVSYCKCVEPTIKPHTGCFPMKPPTFSDLVQSLPMVAMPDNVFDAQPTSLVQYVQSTTKQEFRTDLQGLVTSWMWEGKMQKNAMQKALQAHTSHAFIIFLERFREALRLYCVKYHLLDPLTWVPQWIENTELGTYINVKYRSRTLNMLTRLDLAGNTLKVALGGLFPFLILPLPLATVCSVVNTQLIPSNIFTRLVSHTGTKSKIDPNRPLASIAEFWWREYVRYIWYPFFERPYVMKYAESVVRWRCRRRILDKCVEDTKVVLRKPQVKFFLLGTTALLIPRIASSVAICCTLYNYYQQLVNRSDKANRAVASIWNNVKSNAPSVVRDQIVPGLLSGYATYVGIPWAYNALSEAHRDTSIFSQSALNPTPQEIRARDDAAPENKFYATKFEDRVLDTLPVKVNQRSGEVANLILKNQCHLRREDDIVCNGLLVRSGFAMMPLHMTEKGKEAFTFTRKPNASGKCGNAQFKSILSPVDTERIGDHDLVVAYVPTSGDSKDIVQSFATKTPTAKRSGKLFYRDRDGLMKIYGITDIVGAVTSNNHTINGVPVRFPGLQYEFADNAEGMCMAPIVADDHNSCILGVHLGGDGKSASVAGSPTPEEIEAAIARLCKRAHVSEIAKEGTYITKQYGIDVFLPGIHPKSPLVMLEGNKNYRVFGSTIGRATMSSDVMDTPICKDARRLFDINESWQAPRFRGPDKDSPWLPWLTSLTDSSDPSIGFAGDRVERAANDYMVEIELLLRKDLPFWTKDVTPLSEDENVNGIPNCRFVDALKRTTSVGFPEGGRKDRYLRKEIDPTGRWDDYDILDPKFWVEVMRMEGQYLKGERCYPTFKGACKDEPTLSTKEKVRLFQAAPLAFQLLIRKYYLPVARFMSLNPLLCECAVGVNPTSKEWDELGKFIAKYDSEKVLAIDYKKYDLKMPAQLTLCALKIMRKIAALCGYSENDLKIMEGIATDIAWPMCAYNGDLLMLIGSNPSGHNLTVYVNGIVNSLLHRMGFFDAYPQIARTFRSCATLVTYGDDAAGSTKKCYPKYNMNALKAFFAAHGIAITMADKEAEFTNYISMNECDFLKRKFVYDKDFGCVVGPLAEASIHKSLCSILKSKAVSPAEVSAANLCGAAESYFFHGRKEFDRVIPLLREISENHEYGYMTKALHATFDERLELWKSRNP